MMAAVPASLLRRTSRRLPSQLSQLDRAARAVAAQRSFRATPGRLHGEYEHQEPSSPEDVVRVTFIARDGSRHLIPNYKFPGDCKGGLPGGNCAQPR